MTAQPDKEYKILKDIIAEVSRVVIGKDEIKELLLVALLSQGHVLIEGLPGTAKTTIARTFAHAIGGKFKRVQGTPDMLPSDILGFYLYRPDGTSSFVPGPIFANVVLVDELNRTTPRTQAALLEAMQEHQVTIERVTHPIELPFIVIANQLGYGGVGTSPLSEVQLDRFMFRVWSGLPSTEDEERVLENIDTISDPQISVVATTGDVIGLQQEVKKVHVAAGIRRYIVSLLDSLRHQPDVTLGPGPRAGISLFKGARALAFAHGRDFVIPDDVKSLLIPALSHRLRISAEADMENISPEAIINRVAAELPVPREAAAAAPGTENIRTPTAAGGTDQPEATAGPPEPAGAIASGGTPAAAVAGTGAAKPGPVPERPPGSSPGALPDWGWVLISLALVLAAVLITAGLLSLR
ncbi:MAG: AAA family ATPase [Chloroflexi bacterium]|nr:AAA family ATPase [Chloroflexota bacterium]